MKTKVATTILLVLCESFAWIHTCNSQNNGLHVCTEIREHSGRTSKNDNVPDLAKHSAIVIQKTEDGETNWWVTGQTLRVKFLGGSQYVQNKVKQYALEWCNHANIKFEFTSSGYAEIRISFIANGFSHSCVGKIALKVPQDQPTMNFGWFNDNTPDKEFRRTTLHEFGHALGLVHEHQHPQNEILWNKPKVYEVYAGSPNFWDKPTVDRNIFQRYSGTITNYSQYDRFSIMHYPIDKELTLNGYHVDSNDELSATDKEYIVKWYPFGPVTKDKSLEEPSKPNSSKGSLEEPSKPNSSKGALDDD